MNRAEFMKKLRMLLADMEAGERESALEYYEEYFDDAGEEKEQEVITSLGTPEKVAQTILAGLKDDDGKGGEFSENGFHMHESEKKDEIGAREKQPDFKRGKGLGASGMILILILAIFALPILVPCCIGVIALIFGLLTAAAAILFAVAIAGVALVAAGIALVVSAFPGMFISPAIGIVLIGLGFLLTGIGILLAVFGIWIAWKLIPPVIRWSVSKIQKLFAGKERQS